MDAHAALMEIVDGVEPAQPKDDHDGWIGPRTMEKLKTQHRNWLAARRLAAALPALVAVIEKFMEVVTAETKEEWMKSQRYREAPYHFGYAALAAVREEAEAKEEGR